MNLHAQQLAENVREILAKLRAANADADLDGGKANLLGPILRKDHQGYRAELRRELIVCLEQLAKLGYEVDERGTLVAADTIDTTLGALL